MKEVRRIVVKMPAKNRNKWLKDVAFKLSESAVRVVNTNGISRFAMPPEFLLALIINDTKEAYVDNEAKLFFDIYVLNENEIYLGYSVGKWEEGKAAPKVVSARKFVNRISL